MQVLHLALEVHHQSTFHTVPSEAATAAGFWSSDHCCGCVQLLAEHSQHEQSAISPLAQGDASAEGEQSSRHQGSGMLTA